MTTTPPTTTNPTTTNPTTAPGTTAPPASTTPMPVLRPFETTVDGLVLRGTLYLPAAGGPFPVALLLHGFGGNRVEVSGAFVRLGRELARRGIATIAYDRAGHGESDGSFFDTTASGDLRQAVEVVRSLSRVTEVDPGNLHVVGMSLGAVVASGLAPISPRPVRSLTLWSAAASFADEIGGGHLQGQPVDVIERDGYFDFHGMRLGPAMIADARGYDVYGRAAGYPGPVRILHGTADFIPVAYARRFVEIYGGRAELTVVDGADHGWARVPHRDLVIGQTVDFVARHARGGDR